jgi:conjugal transfer pilus assembly protein TraB
MEEMLSKLLQLNQARKASSSSDPRESTDSQVADPHVGEQRLADSRVGDLRDELKAVQRERDPTEYPTKNEKAAPSHASTGAVLPPPPGSASQVTDDFSPAGQIMSTHSTPFRSKTVRKVSLSLRNARNNKPLKTVDNTVPAGAFARAILLGGVDASASIQASSDPRPALLRLMDAGTLPRKFHSDLKGCHVLAACYGDISSERVFMRLEKLTCTERKTGELIEVKVQGYVAGEDGRTGVRGSVVDRAGESMRNAMIGGFLGGIGDFLSQSQNAVTFSPLSGMAQTNPMKPREMFQHGAGKGVNNALEKYADFYIKRAEQVQPVIQVAAGRQVDVVFTEGVSLEDSLYRQVLGRTHDQERYHQLQSVQEEPQKSVNDWTSSARNDEQE